MKFTDDHAHWFARKLLLSPALSSISNGGEGDQSMVQARLIGLQINPTIEMRPSGYAKDDYLGADSYLFVYFVYFVVGHLRRRLMLA